MSKRGTHSPELKAQVAMETINGRKTIQVSQWTRQQLGGASELFSNGKDEEDELVHPIGWAQSTNSGSTAKR